jgi:uncharacterized membrane protein
MKVNLKVVLVCLLLVCLTAGVTYAILGSYQRDVEVGWTVVENEGLEVYPSRILLGKIVRGSSKTATLYVKNTAGEWLRVSIYPLQTPSGITITISPNSFILPPIGEATQKVTITVYVAKSAPLGNYSVILRVAAYGLPWYGGG